MCLDFNCFDQSFSMLFASHKTANLPHTSVRAHGGKKQALSNFRHLNPKNPKLVSFMGCDITLRTLYHANGRKRTWMQPTPSTSLYLNPKP